MLPVPEHRPSCPAEEEAQEELRLNENKGPRGIFQNQSFPANSGW